MGLLLRRSMTPHIIRQTGVAGLRALILLICGGRREGKTNWIRRLSGDVRLSAK